MLVISTHGHDDENSSASETNNGISESSEQTGSSTRSGLPSQSNFLIMVDSTKRDESLTGLKGISRVPTHTVNPARERRAYIRANLILPLTVNTVAGRPQEDLTE